MEILQKEIASAEEELATLPAPREDRIALAEATQTFTEREARRRVAAGKFSAVEAEVAAAIDARANAGRLLQDFTDDRPAWFSSPSGASLLPTLRRGLSGRAPHRDAGQPNLGCVPYG